MSATKSANFLIFYTSYLGFVVTKNTP
jgi:hypothetical protein